MHSFCCIFKNQCIDRKYKILRSILNFRFCFNPLKRWPDGRVIVCSKMTRSEWVHYSPFYTLSVPGSTSVGRSSMGTPKIRQRVATFSGGALCMGKSADHALSLRVWYGGGVRGSKTPSDRTPIHYRSPRHILSHDSCHGYTNIDGAPS